MRKWLVTSAVLKCNHYELFTGRRRKQCCHRTNIHVMKRPVCTTSVATCELARNFYGVCATICQLLIDNLVAVMNAALRGRVPESIAAA